MTTNILVEEIHGAYFNIAVFSENFEIRLLKWFQIGYSVNYLRKLFGDRKGKKWLVMALTSLLGTYRDAFLWGENAHKCPKYLASSTPSAWRGLK
jgi:hypothetical protein